MNTLFYFVYIAFILFIQSICADDRWEIVPNYRCENCTIAAAEKCWKLSGYVGPLLCLKQGYDMNRALQWPDMPNPNDSRFQTVESNDRRFIQLRPTAHYRTIRCRWHFLIAKEERKRRAGTELTDCQRGEEKTGEDRID
ncbi:hypothetical protein niasHT_025545 [Heterodera trifolii]|uniref:Uncharacterized protein n=1 Tax=Heterodera trifolii TaxID=157864 RepID=A0ABD2K886_9BILA